MERPIKTIEVQLFPNYCFALFKYEDRLQVLRVVVSVSLIRQSVSVKIDSAYIAAA